MDISKAGLDLIKKYEGLRLTAYKPVSTEKYWTIGYGHYGADVKEGMTITQAQADAYLKQDCASAVKAVNAIGKDFNQNQFDALVSFTYNCGAGNLRKLCNGRTIGEIGEKIVLYNKAGGVVLKGLVRRRSEEQALYKTAVAGNSKQSVNFGFKVGSNYTLQENMNVRDAAGGNKKKYTQLTINAKSHAVKQVDGSAVLAKGTVVTCKDVKELGDGSTWIKIPSGWVCAVSASGYKYIK